MIRYFKLLGLTIFLVAAEYSVAQNRKLPTRVVSIDYCADQFVLKLLPKARILAVSLDAGKQFSYMRNSADGIPQVRPLAENVLVLQPDLIVRMYGGGAKAPDFFERAGVPVLQLPFVNDIDGIRQSIMTVAARLGVPENGAALVQEMDERLNVLKLQKSNKRVLYMTPTGVTSGPGTLVHEMLAAAGMTNFEERQGWHGLPLERLAYETPDVVAAAFFESNINHASLWSAMRHPLAREQMLGLPTVMLQGAWTSCGAWFLLDAIESLAAVGGPGR